MTPVISSLMRGGNGLVFGAEVEECWGGIGGFVRRLSHHDCLVRLGFSHVALAVALNAFTLGSCRGQQNNQA
jgi:hypothetical protein